MSVMPGFGGQKFDDVALDKAARRSRARPDVDALLEVDGGVTADDDRRVCRGGRRAVRGRLGDFHSGRLRAGDRASCARLRTASRHEAIVNASTGDDSENGCMFQILLIRPGATEYDQQGRIQGTLDIPLCEDGRRQVEAMIEELRAQPIDGDLHQPLPVGRANGRSASAKRST